MDQLIAMLSKMGPPPGGGPGGPVGAGPIPGMGGPPGMPPGMPGMGMPQGPRPSPIMPPPMQGGMPGGMPGMGMPPGMGQQGQQSGNLVQDLINQAVSLLNTVATQLMDPMSEQAVRLQNACMEIQKVGTGMMGTMHPLGPGAQSGFGVGPEGANPLMRLPDVPPPPMPQQGAPPMGQPPGGQGGPPPGMGGMDLGSLMG